MVEQLENRPKDIYISVYLEENKTNGKIVGWGTRVDFLNTNPIENNGYLDNYVLYDNQLRSIEDFTLYINNFFRLDAQENF